MFNLYVNGELKEQIEESEGLKPSDLVAKWRKDNPDDKSVVLVDTLIPLL